MPITVKQTTSGSGTGTAVTLTFSTACTGGNGIGLVVARQRVDGHVDAEAIQGPLPSGSCVNDTVLFVHEFGPVKIAPAIHINSNHRVQSEYEVASPLVSREDPPIRI